MCVLSIKVPIRKKSGNLFNDPRRSQTSTTNLGHSGPGSNDKGYTTFPKFPRLEPHYQMRFSIISRTLVGEVGLTPLQR